MNNEIGMFRHLLQVQGVKSQYCKTNLSLSSGSFWDFGKSINETGNGDSEIIEYFDQTVSDMYRVYHFV